MSTVNYLIERARNILQDTTGVRWPEKELIEYMNDAQLEVVLHKPDASSENGLFTCVQGARQTLASITGALRLLDVMRNMGTNGTTPGKAVSLIGRGVLDAQRRAWHSETAASAVDHYVYDSRDPRTFYVFPPAVSGIRLEILYSKTPTTLTSGNSPLQVESIYYNALLDFMLYRAYSKDADFAANLERAMMHYQAFATSMGLTRVINTAYTPRADQRDTRDSIHQSPAMG
jgi:hypothetical protein